MTYLDYIANKIQPKSFAYLDDLIKKGNGKIKLKYNIRMNEDEKSRFENGILIDRDCIIDGRGHSIDAKRQGRIFRLENGEITLKNLTLKNGYAQEEMNGGAIRNARTAKTTLYSVKLVENEASYNGGAIINRGEMRIINTSFNNNKAEFEGGGAIYNKKHGRIELRDCIFHENESQYDGGAISSNGFLKANAIECKDNKTWWPGGAIKNNKDGTMEILSSAIIKNKSRRHGGAISNRGSLAIIGTKISENSSKKHGGAIFNHAGGSVNASNCEISKNSSKLDGGAIFNRNGEIYLIHTKIHANACRGKGGGIWAEKNMRVKFDNCKLSENTPDDAHYVHMPSNRNRNPIPFTKCDTYTNPRSLQDIYNLIHSGYTNINLDSDIYITSSDFRHFSAGVKLGDVTIDGCGHTIDGDEWVRPFAVYGHAILKNITFKNCGILQIHGGAVENMGECEIINCKFIECESRFGGAVSNFSRLKIKDSLFAKNRARNSGGAIHNERIALIESSEFESNNSDLFGGGINNEYRLTIRDSYVHDNRAGRRGGGINNFHVLDESNNTFKNNRSSIGEEHICNHFGTGR